VHTVLPLPLGLRGCFGVVLVALALWTQALAPVAALRMVAAMSDPLRNPVICGHAVDGTGEARVTADVPAPALPRCDLCQLCCAGITPPTVAPGSPSIGILLWHPVSWPIPPPTPSTSPACHPGQPRAPPDFA
jgi:hypothetical protein